MGGLRDIRSGFGGVAQAHQVQRCRANHRALPCGSEAGESFAIGSVSTKGVAPLYIGFAMTGKHEETTVNLDMPFEEGVRRLSTRKGSQVAESGSTKSAC